MKIGTSIALGAFDGLHLGHMQVINKAIEKAGSNLIPSVLTFIEDPSKILTGKTEYLLTHYKKDAILKKMGIINIFSLDFKEFCDYTPKEFFAEIIVKKCDAGVIICGENYRFGKDALGNTECLKELCEKYNIELVIVPPLIISGEIVSSTRIRAALICGNVKLANELMGRRFFFDFTVVEGNKIGRTLGTPTINQKLPNGFVMPKFGVYASLVFVDNQCLCGVTNIGVKPTVGTYEPLSETWIPDFQKDMYGMKIRVELVEFIRSEKKFTTLEELRAEIYSNAVTAREICSCLKN